MPIPSKCPWGLRKIFNARELALQHVCYRVGNNSSMLLWHDPWLRNKSPIQLLGQEIISHTESQNLARVNSVLTQDGWNFGSSNHLLVIELRHLCTDVVPIANDKIEWDGSCNQVKLATIWHSLRPIGTICPWTKILWNNTSVAKYSFITWVAIQERLPTKDRILHFGLQVISDCVLCVGHMENHAHLFCNCVFTRAIFNSWPVAITNSWQDIKSGNVWGQYSMDATRSHITYLFVTAVIHAVWMERNHRIHSTSNQRKSASCLEAEIKRNIRDKIASRGDFAKRLRRDQSLLTFLY